MPRFEPGPDWLNATGFHHSATLDPFFGNFRKMIGNFCTPLGQHAEFFFFFENHRKVACSRQQKKSDFFSIKLRLTDGDLVISCDSQVPFKHDSLLVDKKELKLTKAEKREAKRGKRPILISVCVCVCVCVFLIAKLHAFAKHT